MNKKVQSIAITLISISSISLISKAMGFLREIVLSHFFGTSVIADSYIMAGNIVGVLFGWISTIYVCYTPVFARIVKTYGKQRGADFTRTLITIFELIALICVLFTNLFSESIVQVVAPGFTGESLKLASTFLRSIILILLAQPFIYPFKAYLEYEGEFVQAGLPDMSVSILQTVLIAVSGIVSYRILPYTMSVPYIIQALLLLWLTRKKGLRYYPHFQCLNEMKTLFKLIIPYFLSSLLVEINSFVDRYFASAMETGSISMLNYASVLNSFMLNIFIMAISVVIYPHLTKAYVNNDYKKYNQTLEYGLDFIIIVFIPLLFGILTLSNVIVSCIYGHGAFNMSSITGTSSIFSILALSLPILAIRELLFKALYARENSKLPLTIGAATTAINILLNFLLASKLGTIGLAFATSLSAIITVPILVIIMTIKLHCFSVKHLLLTVGKAMLSSIIMFSVILLYKHYVNFKTGSLFIIWIKLFGCIITASIVYFGSLFLCRIKVK